MSGYQIFICYAHEDETHNSALTWQLEGLQRQGLIAPWTDWCIDGEASWRAEIAGAIDACDLALLLISPAFIASNFIYANEFSRLLGRREQDRIRVVPIIVKPCPWTLEEPINSLQARPTVAEAIINFPEEDGSRAQAWKDIVEEIAYWAKAHTRAERFLHATSDRAFEWEPDQATPTFHFVLEGDEVRGNLITEFTRATLHFRYEAPTTDPLAVVDDAVFDAGRQANLEVTLNLTPIGAITVVGDRKRVARIRSGRLEESLAFRLRAGAFRQASAAEENVDGAHVEFVVAGETVHQLMLEMRVVPEEMPSFSAGDDTQRASVLTDTGISLELMSQIGANSPAPKHHVRLILSVDGMGLRVDLEHLVDGSDWYADSATARNIDRAAVNALARHVRGKLRTCYGVQVSAWQAFDGRVSETDTALQEALENALSCTAAAGSALNQALRQDADIARLLDYVEDEIPSGAVITVLTDSVYLPWELLTRQQWALDLSPAQKAQLPPPNPALFWGVRFAIETLPRNEPLGQRRLTHLRAAPRQISVNLNPDIRINGLGDFEQPLAVHKAWASQLAAQGHLDGAVNEACASMRGVLQDANNQASLIYIYCHGQSDDPFGGIDERLVLDDGCDLDPESVRLGDIEYAAAPLVFLNACESGTPSPFAYSNFLKAFCKRGALGLIGTTNSVPITFGAHFGPDLVERYLHCSGSLAETLRALREEHLTRGNPIPLFYTLQCQLTFPPSASQGVVP